MEETPPNENEVIRINVGGVLYMTTIHLICRHRNSHLYELICEKLKDRKSYDTQNCNQEIFIDRNGKRFEYILDFLRDGVLICENDLNLLAQILIEAIYFELFSLIKILKKKIYLLYSKLDSSVNRKIARSVLTAIEKKITKNKNEEIVDIFNESNILQNTFFGCGNLKYNKFRRKKKWYSNIFDTKYTEYEKRKKYEDVISKEFRNKNNQTIKESEKKEPFKYIEQFQVSDIEQQYENEKKQEIQKEEQRKVQKEEQIIVQKEEQRKVGGEIQREVEQKNNVHTNESENEVDIDLSKKKKKKIIITDNNFKNSNSSIITTTSSSNNNNNNNNNNCENSNKFENNNNCENSNKFEKDNKFENSNNSINNINKNKDENKIEQNKYNKKLNSSHQVYNNPLFSTNIEDCESSNSDSYFIQINNKQYNNTITTTDNITNNFTNKEKDITIPKKNIKVNEGGCVFPSCKETFLSSCDHDGYFKNPEVKAVSFSNMNSVLFYNNYDNICADDPIKNIYTSNTISERKDTHFLRNNINNSVIINNVNNKISDIIQKPENNILVYDDINDVEETAPPPIISDVNLGEQIFSTTVDF